MKQVFVLDNDELIVKFTLLHDMMYRIHCDAWEKIDEAENRVDAEGALYCYAIIEKRVNEVYQAHGFDRLNCVPEFQKQIDKKFPPEENNSSDTSGKDGFDDIINDDDVPF